MSLRLRNRHKQQDRARWTSTEVRAITSYVRGTTRPYDDTIHARMLEVIRPSAFIGTQSPFDVKSDCFAGSQTGEQDDVKQNPYQT